MNTFTKTAIALVFTICITSCSEQKSVSEFSTEEIVAEYHLRLQEILDDDMTALQEATNPMKGTSAKITPETTRENATSLFVELVAELIPYANAGETAAEAIFGASILAKEERYSTEHDRGFYLVRKAAKKGSTEAAVYLSGYYLLCALDEASNQSKYHDLAYFWAKEAERNNPIWIGLVDTATYNIDQDQLSRLRVEWNEWSPRLPESAPVCEIES